MKTSTKYMPLVDVELSLAEIDVAIKVADRNGQNPFESSSVMKTLLILKTMARQAKTFIGECGTRLRRLLDDSDNSCNIWVAFKDEQAVCALPQEYSLPHDEVTPWPRNHYSPEEIIDVFKQKYPDGPPEPTGQWVPDGGFPGEDVFRLDDPFVCDTWSPILTTYNTTKPTWFDRVALCQVKLSGKLLESAKAEDANILAYNADIMRREAEAREKQTIPWLFNEPAYLHLVRALRPQGDEITSACPVYGTISSVLIYHGLLAAGRIARQDYLRVNGIAIGSEDERDDVTFTLQAQS